jgi:hypothetical protein
MRICLNVRHFVTDRLNLTRKFWLSQIFCSKIFTVIKGQWKLFCYRHAEDKGGRSIATTQSWPRHYKGWVVSVTPLLPGMDPGTHYTGGWMGLRTGPDSEARGKILCLYLGSKPGRPIVHSVVRHCIDRATLHTIWNLNGNGFHYLLQIRHCLNI